MLGWLVYEHGLEPHVTVFDKSARQDGTSPATNSPMIMTATQDRALAFARHGLNPVAVADPAGLLRDVLSASGMRRFTLLELSGVEVHEVAHVRRCFAVSLHVVSVMRS